MPRKRHSTRRDFLKGRAAVDALHDATSGVGGDSAEPASSEPLPERSLLVHFTRQAMACNFEIWLNAGQNPQGAEAALAALDLVDQLENQLSVYREHSELSELNRRAAEELVFADAELFDLLLQSFDISRSTDGAYDPTAGPLSRAWGFFYRAGRVPGEQEIVEALGRMGIDKVALDRDVQTVKFLERDVELNVNGIGKGYALDRCRDLMMSEEVDDFVIHGGQSSVTAHGRCATSEQHAWTIGLRHPLRPEKRLAEFYLKDQSLATSGSATQHFVHQGQRYGHVLDPRTGRPAMNVYSSTVIAPTAAEADALSTAFYVMGPAAALEYCRERPHLATVITCPGPRQGSIEVHHTGLPEDTWELREGTTT